MPVQRIPFGRAAIPRAEALRWGRTTGRHRCRNSGMLSLRRREQASLYPADVSATTARLRDRDQEPLNRSFLILSALIFDSNVEPGMPSFAAAPDGPATRPRLAVNARSIASRSRAARSSESD